LRNPNTGHTLKESIAAMMATPEYEAATDERKGEAIKERILAYRNAARGAMVDPESEFYMPDLAEAMQAAGSEYMVEQ
jgi:hypothetical protein